MPGKKTVQLEDQIKRYLQDQMTRQERHAFEREMQHDQFLAEAVEGYSVIPAELVGPDLSDLKTRIYKRQKGNRKYIWFAAASLIFLVVSSVLLFNLKENNRQIISENKIQQKAVPKKEFVTEQKENVLREPAEIIKIAPKKNIAKTVFDSSALAFREVDTSKKPIRIRGTSTPDDIVIRQTVSELQPDSEKIEKALASAARETKAMDEVVVVGYGIQKKSSVTGSVSSVNTDQKVDGNASPATGWITFNKYLKDALLTPDIGLPDGTIVVRLSFVITETGTMEQIKVLSGKNERYNKEAIRILTDGPKWNPRIKSQVPQHSVVKLRMVFQPADKKVGK